MPNGNVNNTLLMDYGPPGTGRVQNISLEQQAQAISQERFAAAEKMQQLMLQERQFKQQAEEQRRQAQT